MKITGIVRRVDDIGRIAIPKEIRKRLNIKEGSLLEICLTDEGGVTFIPYNEFQNLNIDAMYNTLKRHTTLAIIDEDGNFVKGNRAVMEAVDYEKENGTYFYYLPYECSISGGYNIYPIIKEEDLIGHVVYEINEKNKNYIHQVVKVAVNMLLNSRLEN